MQTTKSYPQKTEFDKDCSKILHVFVKGDFPCRSQPNWNVT